MLIRRIKARNFKTYLDLDLDLTVSHDRPIILIGGANGGGKTTLFEAIYGALYGLTIPNNARFSELVNAGVSTPGTSMPGASTPNNEEKKITLEIHFSGQVLNQTQQYILTRTYILNSDNKPVESVRLNMDGAIFQYGTATPVTQRAQQQAQVDKIIKANLPQELSRYFLFDAMEAGNLLKEDQLNRVIRENIENVMGFNKYLTLAKAAERVYQDWTAQRLRVEKEKDQYRQLVEKKRGLDKQQQQLKDQHTDALQYSVTNKDLYEGLKAGLNQETTLKNKIDQLTQQLASVSQREAAYTTQIDTFVKNFEQHICLPKLAESLRSEITLLIKARADYGESLGNSLTPERIEQVVRALIYRLHQQQVLSEAVDISALTTAIIQDLPNHMGEQPYSFLDNGEVKALAMLTQTVYTNPFLVYQAQQTELNLALNQLPKQQRQISELKAQIAGKDYSQLRAYEDNEGRIRELENQLRQIDTEIKQVDKQIVQFDIQMQDEPDPRYEALKRLKPFFETTANQLLKAKKRQLEQRMKEDLNINLVAYKGVINRVELSEDLRDLSFRIYHQAGNEIYLSQLNTASKQVVVQVLLKALHEFGDYDPPVMIDTVMGVFGSETREAIVENYFPDLSSQTILLSSDEEIRLGKEYEALEPFISKTFTLVRDRYQQRTTVSEGYFGHSL